MDSTVTYPTVQFFLMLLLAFLAGCGAGVIITNPKKERSK